MIPFAIKKALYYLPHQLVLRLSARSNMEGVHLFIFMQNRDRATLLRTKTATALRLIQTYTPKFYTRVQEFIPNLLIFGTHAYDAVYISDLKLCDISRQYALSERTSPSRLAMTLVHESTHGYIASRGCSYEEHRRAQIERICVRAEIAFARRLPDPGNLVAEAEAVLNFPSEFWRSEAFSERNIKRLEVINAPRWMVNHLRNRRAKEDQQTSPPQGSQLISRVRASVPRAEGSEDLEPDRRIDL